MPLPDLLLWTVLAAEAAAVAAPLLLRCLFEPVFVAVPAVVIIVVADVPPPSEVLIGS